ncbi:unnamed protein product [Closterium sp. NIES-64]|nr:unnamed protein product [Closterium sp. NIES-64]
MRDETAHSQHLLHSRVVTHALVPLVRVFLPLSCAQKNLQDFKAAFEEAQEIHSRTKRKSAGCTGAAGGLAANAASAPYPAWTTEESLPPLIPPSLCASSSLSIMALCTAVAGTGKGMGVKCGVGWWGALEQAVSSLPWGQHHLGWVSEGKGAEYPRVGE